MSLFVLDTDTVVLFQEGHEAVSQRILSHSIDELAITVITIEEQLSGWYTLIRRAKTAEKIARAYQRLAESVTLLGQFRILPFTEDAIGEFQQMRRQKLQVKHMDLRIAAIALLHKATLVTRNTRDFQRIPGIRIEDWSI